MIYQGGNLPIRFEFDSDMEKVKEIHITIYAANGKQLKQWEKEELTISNKLITAPLSQEETLSFPCGKIQIEIKWLNPDTYVELAEVIWDRVAGRNDHSILGGDSH
ncbi:hypothetical protein [uncultured Clostridium sp.]|uniref:hypothetical protein n=1 Tax=uncultured Clostridium sp. TaxID=59620 RepID=UPI0025CCCA9E|nr:hypothetical protein [uncultured Clostridium sp.]